MKQTMDESIHAWLDEAGTAMGGDPAARRDALRELEGSIYERIEERSGTEPAGAALVRDVLDLMGDPVEVGSSMLPTQPLLAAHQTRSYLRNVAVLFAVHFLVVIGATLAGRVWSLLPIEIRPIADPRNLFVLFRRAAETLLFDMGTVLAAQVLLRRLGRYLRFPRAALAVRPTPRRCLESALFFALVLVVVNFLRQNLLVAYLPVGETMQRVSLVGPGITSNVALLDIWLVASIARELLYFRLGERRLTLGIDIATGATGLFCLLRIVATRSLVDLSGARAALGASADVIGGVLNTAFMLLALAGAALLAARTVRRACRFALVPR